MDERAENRTSEERIPSLTNHVPYLRRYARALTGEPGQGDELVIHALHDAMNGHIPDQGLSSLLPALYARLNALADALPPRPASSHHPVEAALSNLNEIDRRLYLLVNLEDLSIPDAAAVLGIPAEQAVDRLTTVREQVRARLMAVILIVEDDAIIAYDLAETVRAMGHLVCGTAPTMDEALALAIEHTPTLALLDIRLADGDNGIEVARELRRRRFLPVIFVTAFPDELSKRGLEHLGPVIPKPFTREQIEQAITRAVFTPHPDDGERRAMTPARFI